MAASDQFYRNQKTLNVIFAISSLLMLASVIWMFWVDHNRPYKTEQRIFTGKVKVARAQHKAITNLPDEDTFQKAKMALQQAEKERRENSDKIRSLSDEIDELEPLRDKKEATFQNIKAQLTSIQSFYDKAVNDYGIESNKAQKYKEEIDELNAQLVEAQAERDFLVNQIKMKQTDLDQYEQNVAKAQTELKRVNSKFIAQVKLAAKSQWGLGDVIRSLPVIDGFASPTKIHQITLENIPIDYNFKYVTRFDRCMTCHMGIDDETYSKGKLRDLWFKEQQLEYINNNPLLTNREKFEEKQKVKKRYDMLARKLAEARERLAEYHKALAGTADVKGLPQPEQLQLIKISKDLLTESRINQFCAHPRLDLFVGANSKHPVEKFGCTSCHRGQGSATEFSLASHTPNSSLEEEIWEEKHAWESNHYWDFPMLPQRFVESSCLKCHYEVTDLITTENRNEAPKLVRGYNLIKDYGCYGCHEIQGRKYNRQIGPDMRLEPSTPLEEMNPLEREALEADPDNRPGTLRKVGPSLYRVAEKVDKQWAEKWLRSPRDFRPDTRMPHYYGLSTNHPDVLPEDQKKFPDAEIHSIVHYLFQESDKQIEEVAQFEKETNLESLLKKDQNELTEKFMAKQRNLTEEERKTLDKDIQSLKTRIRAKKEALEIRKSFTGLNAMLDENSEQYYPGDPYEGQRVFMEKGCLACHRHIATEEDSDYPAMPSEAQFAPDLSQIKAKLVNKGEDMKSAMKWLAHWIKNPHVHSPRSKMPVVTMSNKEVIDVSIWLLSQDAKRLGKDWGDLKVPTPDEETLYQLAEVYLVRLLSKGNLQKIKDNVQKVRNNQEPDNLDPVIFTALPKPEQELLSKGYHDVDNVKYYLGQKAIGRLGCFACHDIPGFGDTKPIGTGLNDWGKKDTAKLAFENIVNYVKKNYHGVERLVDEEGHALPAVEEDGKKKLPYEEFFLHALKHHQREGFLHQKLLEPRSYDYGRIRAWDDRSRMPQFRFAGAIRKPKESNDDFKARQWKEEAEAREAVMTFVLGLVAEKVPEKSIHQPQGDRLAVVKGRKVLEKFNCAGCHLVQPGFYEMERSDPTRELFTKTYKSKLNERKQDFDFLKHHAWAGKLPSPTADRFQFQALNLTYPKNLPDAMPLEVRDELFKDIFKSDFGSFLRLTEAVRFKDTEDGNIHDLRAFDFFQVLPEQMLSPKGRVFEKEDLWEKFHKKGGAYGGEFGALLVNYLMRMDPGKYKAGDDPLTYESKLARSSGPPSLIGQGARTQPDWLAQFLLNPHPIRKMTVLRMPKFNLSKKEARQLVNYFAALEKLTNPKIELSYPYTDIPQKSDLDSPFWKAKTAEYVARLKAQGKLESRWKEIEEIWYKINQDYKRKMEVAKSQAEEFEPLMDPLKTKTAEFQKKIDKANMEKIDLEAAIDKAEKEEEKTKLEAQVKAVAEKLSNLRIQKKKFDDKLSQLNSEKGAWNFEYNRLKKLWEETPQPPTDEDIKKKNDPLLQKLRQQWLEEEAYVVDAFRLLANPQSACLQCHQVGNQMPTDDEGQGPPLYMAEKRLRPGWTRHWIANPQRMMPYVSPMPAYFQANSDPKQYPQFVGEPLDQITALSDVLMIYQRAMDMPVNRYWMLPTAKGEKK